MEDGSTARFHRARQIFEALCDVREPSRDRKVIEMCGGDARLLQTVRAMLARDAAGGASLDAPPAMAALTLLADVPELQGAIPGPLRQLAAGERVGRYVIAELLGAGGMGMVYRAHDSELDRDVALKLVRVHEGRDVEAARRKLLEEARALARLSHPHVIAVHDVGAHDGDVFVAMELVRGRTLGEWLRDGSRSTRQILEVFGAAGTGLAAAHAAGLVHRDFKPSNVLVGGDGRVLVVDFGLALPTGTESAEQPATGGRARVTTVAGTPAYMAPEQFHSHEVGPHADQFSFCMALHEALFGRPPSPAHGQELVPSRGRVPRRVRAALLRGLASEPENRFPSMAPLLAALRPRSGARRTAAILAALLVTVVGLVATRALWQRHELARAREAREASAAGRLAAIEREVKRLDAQGRAAEADAAFTAFVEHPAHQATPALGQAWLARGERLRVQGRPEEEAEAYAAAFVHAVEPGQRQAALVRLAALFERRWMWASLAAVLRSLGPGERAMSPTDLGRLQTALALARRDLGAAAAGQRGAEGTAPLLEALARATPTDRHADLVTFIDVDGDGVDEAVLAHHRQAALEVARADPRLTGLWQTALPDADVPEKDWWMWPVRRRSGGPDAVLLWSELPGEAHVLELTPGVTRELLRWHENSLHSVACTGGAARCFVAAGHWTRKLYELAVGPRGLQLGSPAPSVDSAASDITALTAADFDGDGRDELAVAVGPWRAFDVRLLRAPRAGAPLETVGRRRLGIIDALAALRVGSTGRPLLAVMKSDRARSRIVFPADAPAGVPPGIYLLSTADAGLPTVSFLPIPRPEGEEPLLVYGHPLIAGDLDGDGRDDLVTSGSTRSDDYLLAYRQLEDGGFARALIRGVRLLAARNLDDDPALELVVKLVDTGAIWVLGAGQTPPPPLALAVLAPLEPPQELRDSGIADSWTRAEALVAMGLPEPAAALLDELAVMTSGSQPGALARHRAAELWDSVGQTVRAAEGYLDAARDGHQSAALAADSLDGAARAWIAARRFPEALDANRQLLARGDAGPELVARAAQRAGWLGGAAHPARTLRVGFDRPLDPGWRLASPIGVRREPTAGLLHVSSAGPLGEIASLPLDCDGSLLAVKVDLDVKWTEWGSGFRIVVRPRDREAPDGFGVGLTARGGGGFLEREPGCQRHRKETLFGDAIPIAGPGEPARLRMGVSLVPALDEVHCRIEDGDAKVIAESFAAPLFRPEPGAFELVLENVGIDPRLDMRVDVRAIEVLGCVAAPPPASEPTVAQAHRLLAERQATAALEATTHPAAAEDRDAVALARIVALADLQRPGEAAAGLQRLAAGARHGDRTEALLFALLRMRDRYGALARAGLGPRYFEWYAEAWDPVIAMHDEVELVQRALVADLAGLDTRRLPPAVAIRLLLARGSASSRLGMIEAARADLEPMLALGGPADAGDLEGRERFTIGGLLLAEIEARAGRRDRAVELARRSLSTAASPELALDRLLRQPVLVDLLPPGGWQSFLDGLP